MIDRRTICVGAAVSAFAARTDSAAAMPGSQLQRSGEARWTYVQAIPFAPPPRPQDLVEPKSFTQYLKEGTAKRFAEAGISVDNDAQTEIDQAIARSAEAAFREKRGKMEKGATLDALPIEVRRVVVLRNFNTFVDVLILVSWEEGKKLTRQVVNRVQGFLCPLYPICTG